MVRANVPCPVVQGVPAPRLDDEVNEFINARIAMAQLVSEHFGEEITKGLIAEINGHLERAEASPFICTAAFDAVQAAFRGALENAPQRVEFELEALVDTAFEEEIVDTHLALANLWDDECATGAISEVGFFLTRFRRRWDASNTESELAAWTSVEKAAIYLLQVSPSDEEGFTTHPRGD